MIRIENENEIWYFTTLTAVANYLHVSVQSIRTASLGLCKIKGYTITKINPEDEPIISNYIKA